MAAATHFRWMHVKPSFSFALSSWTVFAMACYFALSSGWIDHGEGNVEPVEGIVFQSAIFSLIAAALAKSLFDLGSSFAKRKQTWIVAFALGYASTTTAFLIAFAFAAILHSQSLALGSLLVSVPVLSIFAPFTTGRRLRKTR